MKINDLLTENKKDRKAVKHTIKPRTGHAPTQTGAGAHKDKKKSEKKGEVKHKKPVDVSEATGNPDADAKIAQIEAHISSLERLLPTVLKISKDNHYVFEEIESQIMGIKQSLEGFDSNSVLDLEDAIDESVQAIRQANGSVYNLEKTIKELLKSAQYEIDDIVDSEEWERRHGTGKEETTENKKFPMAGKDKQGPAGQWSNRGSKKNRPAQRGDLVGSSM